MSTYNINTLQIITLGKYTRYAKRCSVTNKSYQVTITNNEQCRILINQEPIAVVLKHRSAEEVNFIALQLTPDEFKVEYPMLIN